MTTDYTDEELDRERDAVMDLGEAIVAFFTSTVELPGHGGQTCPPGLEGKIWWECVDGWKYPWRVDSYIDGVALGYPCGEPVKL